MGVYKQWTDAFWPPGYKVEFEFLIFKRYYYDIIMNTLIR